jgi:hypothetical protein
MTVGDYKAREHHEMIYNNLIYNNFIQIIH